MSDPDDPGWTSGQNGTPSNETSQLSTPIDLAFRPCRGRGDAVLR